MTEDDCCAKKGCDGTPIVKVTLEDGTKPVFCDNWKHWWGLGAIRVERLDGRPWRIPKEKKKRGGN